MMMLNAENNLSLAPLISVSLNRGKIPVKNLASQAKHSPLSGHAT